MRLDENKLFDEHFLTIKKDFNQKNEEGKENLSGKSIPTELYQDIEWLAILKHINSHYYQIKGEKIFNLNQK